MLTGNYHFYRNNETPAEYCKFGVSTDAHNALLKWQKMNDSRSYVVNDRTDNDFSATLMFEDDRAAVDLKLQCESCCLLCKYFTP